jgi:GNAT superfamily N-acetyltransferase
MSEPEITIEPLDADRWTDLVGLFGPERGAYSRCWCMWWRLTGREFDDLGGGGRRAALRERAGQAPPAGLLAYRDGSAVGWVAVAPRGEFGRLNRSPLLKPVDDASVWAITCLYVAAGQRRTGVARRLVEAAVDLAASHGAPAVEAYPIDTEGDATDSAVFTGTMPMFTGTGFSEVARRKHRPILRRHLS